jgi:PST family polysaccharide transporter
MQDSTHTGTTFIENFVSMGLIQVANLVFPLITFPYLVRILGIERYGLITFAQSYIQYFLIITDYGFALSAARDISVHKDNQDKRSHILSAVLYTKLLLAGCCFLFLVLTLITVPRFHEARLVYILSFGVVIGDILFPTWFFQAVERMKYVTALNISIKSFFLIMVFIFVRTSEDYIYVPLFNSLGYLCVGLISMYLLKHTFHVTLSFPNFSLIRQQLTAGSYIFVSMLSINFCSTTNSFVLGFLVGNVAVGYYAGAEKIILAALALFYPLFQSTYPHIVRTMSENAREGLRKVRKLYFLTVPVSVTLFLVVFLFADRIVYLVLGSKYDASITVLRILSPLLLITTSSYVFANMTMLPLKKDKHFLGVYASGAVVNLVCLFVLLKVYVLGAPGAAICSLITQVYTACLMYYLLRRSGIRIYPSWAS